MPAKGRPTPWRGSSALAAVGLLGYVAARATLVSFTHDESVSFLSFVSRSFRTILTSDGPNRSNNHLLNSALAHLSMLAFGSSEWALRLPNVLAFVLFLAASHALMRRVSNPLAGACGFVLLAANPYVLELFSLERGYGLGLAFMTASLVCLLRSRERSDPAREEALATVCAALAVLSNFTFLLVFGPIVFSIVARRPPRRVADAAPWAIPSVLLAAAVAAPIVTLKRSGQLYFGGTSGFFPDTVRSLIELSLPEARAGSPTERLLEFAVVGALAAGLAVLLLAPTDRAGRHLVSLALLIAGLAGLASTAQHAFMGTPWLLGRTGVFFVPLFVLSTTGTLDVLAGSSRQAVRAAASCLSLILAGGALVNLVAAGNLDHSIVWRFDADTKRMLADLSTARGSTPARTRLCTDGVLEPAASFYRLTEGLDWLEPVARDEISGLCHFVFMQPTGLGLGVGDELLLVRRYPLSGNLLLRLLHAGDPAARPREDPTLTASIDDPGEESSVRGALTVRGWARIPGEDLKVTLFIDGTVVSPTSFTRVPRPDVCRVVPSLGDCSSSGYEALFPFHQSTGAEHDLLAIFETADGRVRHYPVRRFQWQPARIDPAK